MARVCPCLAVPCHAIRNSTKSVPCLVVSSALLGVQCHVMPCHSGNLVYPCCVFCVIVESASVRVLPCNVISSVAPCLTVSSWAQWAHAMGPMAHWARPMAPRIGRTCETPCHSRVILDSVSFRALPFHHIVRSVSCLAIKLGFRNVPCHATSSHLFAVPCQIVSL